MKPILVDDLNYIIRNSHTVWEELRNKCIFITGGTGFFGCWLLEALTWANQQLNLNLSVVVLTRNLPAFRKKAPHLADDPCIQFHLGDVQNFIFPQGDFSHVIHAATEASAELNKNNPQVMRDTILQGTEHTLNCAVHAGANKFLFVSSGAVYGKQPTHIEHLEETYLGKPDFTDALSTYAAGKYQAEKYCLDYARQHALEIKMARCFAFVGPYLPLDRHFAIGNFIRDGLLGDIIYVNGDGSPYRSYLYAADLVIWLLRILCHGENQSAYNVGSDESISIADLAMQVARSFSTEKKVVIAKQSDSSQLPVRYVPSIDKISKKLKITEIISLEQAIKKTIAWYKEKIT